MVIGMLIYGVDITKTRHFQEGDIGNDKDKGKDKDKDKDKDKVLKRPDMCYIFEKQKVQGYQI